MAWTRKGSWIITKSETQIQASFKSRLAVKVSNVANLKDTWYWAGHFYQYLSIPLIGLARIDEKLNVPIREPVIFIPQRFEGSYALKYFLADWIDYLTLTIYEDSMPLNSYAEVSIPNIFAGTTNSTTIPVSATSVSFLAANANRKRLIVANNSNQDLYIDFDATAAVADHTIKIPKVSAGGQIFTYEMDNYTGVVSGIWGAAGSGAALVKEMVA